LTHTPAPDRGPWLQSPEALFPGEFKGPTLIMQPFDAAAMQDNLELVRGAGGPAGEPNWSHHFGAGGVYTATVNGREAIGLALDELDLSPADEVVIVTTSGGPYVSACVTEAISARCGWTRTLGSRARAILVIHEFGFPARLTPELASAGLPVIEDVAYALGAHPADGTTGRLGDYVIYSFAKSIPVSFGGLLKSPGPLRGVSALSAHGRHELFVLAPHYLDRGEASYARRRELFELYRQRFAAFGFSPLFEPEGGAVPHAFVVTFPDEARAQAMKTILQAQGIISSVYYGGGGYFLPNHQRLSEAAVDYVVAHFMAAYDQTAD
jgi:dTDP-4-amino-4,6-dideoxygalactose transaminase